MPAQSAGIFLSQKGSGQVQKIDSWRLQKILLGCDLTGSLDDVTATNALVFGGDEITKVSGK